MKIDLVFMYVVYGVKQYERIFYSILDIFGNCNKAFDYKTLAYVIFVLHNDTTLRHCI